MVRYLFSLLLPLFSFAALAQSAAEAPVEKASPLVVVLFGIVFVASCVGVLGWMWWNNKKKDGK